MRPLARIPLVATAALMLFTSTASAQIGQRRPRRRRRPDRARSRSPHPCERVTVFASCTVARRTGTTVWFGYSNPWLERRVALVGPGNTVCRERSSWWRLKPGPGHPVPTRCRRTCVRGHGARRIDRHLDRHAGEHPRCERCCRRRPRAVRRRRRVPPVSVCVRRRPDRREPVPTISCDAGNQLISNGLLVRSSLQFSTNGVVSACSDGGVPLAPRCCGATT